MAQTRILYIEDYPVVQQIYVEVLRKHFHVDVAADGKQALSLVKTHKYDLILVDLLLPEMSGLEFIRAYKKGDHKQDESTRMVVLSDFDSPETQKDVRDLGITEYWIKVENTPYALVENINKLLGTND